MPGILINGIVSSRDHKPYVQLDIDGHILQMSMAEARNVARDIEVTCARAEADAMIHQFFAKSEFPAEAAASLMVEFRDFRAKLDEELVERTRMNPDV